MRKNFGHAAVALALLAGTGPAGAQWIYTQDPVAARPLVAAEPLPLTQAQRTIIYRTIIPQGRNRRPIIREQIVSEPVAPAPVVRERVIGAPFGGGYDAYGFAPAVPGSPRVIVREPDAYGSYAYAVGTRLPPTARLAPLPQTVVTAVPAVRPYRYMVVNDRLLLVDPATGVVVADLTE